MSNRSDLLISSFSGIIKFLNFSLLLLSFSILAQLSSLSSNEICINSILVSGLPKNFHESNFKPPYEVPCIIQLLCDKHEGLVLEAKGIKEHWFKPYIKKIFDRKVWIS